jgi:hypothetical protein
MAQPAGQIKRLTCPESAGSLHLRYGVGQLADYAYRYKSETAGATKVLAFGQPPDRDTSWIAGMLDEERIAFVSQTNDHIVALNEQAKKLRIFQ